MTEDQWWALFDPEPLDRILALAFADWLEERDDERAASIRWVVGNGYEPVKASWSCYLEKKGPSWDWWSGGDRNHITHEEEFRALGPPAGATELWDVAWMREYPTRIAAFQALIKAHTDVHGARMERR